MRRWGKGWGSLSLVIDLHQYNSFMQKNNCSCLTGPCFMQNWSVSSCEDDREIIPGVIRWRLSPAQSYWTGLSPKVIYHSRVTIVPWYLDQHLIGGHWGFHSWSCDAENKNRLLLVPSVLLPLLFLVLFSIMPSMSAVLLLCSACTERQKRNWMMIWSNRIEKTRDQW